jgi:hypothetical protein
MASQCCSAPLFVGLPAGLSSQSLISTATCDCRAFPEQRIAFCFIGELFGFQRAVSGARASRTSSAAPANSAFLSPS